MSWRGARMAVNGTGSLVFIDDVTADKSSRMNSEVFQVIYYLLIFSQMLQNSLDGTSQCSMDNDPKHTAKATKGKEVECYAMAKSMT